MPPNSKPCLFVLENTSAKQTKANKRVLRRMKVKFKSSLVMISEWHQRSKGRSYCSSGLFWKYCQNAPFNLVAGSHLWNFGQICVCFRLKICHHVTFPNANGFSPVQKKIGKKSTKLQRRRSAWVGLADFEKIEEKKGSRFRSCHH